MRCLPFARIIMHSTLQEMSRNVDTMALAGPKQLPELMVVREALGDKFSAKACLVTWTVQCILL